MNSKKNSCILKFNSVFLFGWNYNFFVVYRILYEVISLGFTKRSTQYNLLSMFWCCTIHTSSFRFLALAFSTRHFLILLNLLYLSRWQKMTKMSFQLWFYCPFLALFYFRIIFCFNTTLLHLVHLQCASSTNFHKLNKAIVKLGKSSDDCLSVPASWRISMA